MLRKHLLAMVPLGCLFVTGLVVSGCSQPSGSPSSPEASSASGTAAAESEDTGAAQVSVASNVELTSSATGASGRGSVADPVAASSHAGEGQGVASEGDPSREKIPPIVGERAAEEGTDTEDNVDLDDDDESLEEDAGDDESNEDEEFDDSLPPIGSGLKFDEDGNEIPDGPPPVPNDDPQNLYGEVPKDWKKIAAGQATWIDKKNGTVIFDGWICRKTGLLEMLVCSGGFKEHESVIAAYTKPSVVTAALMVVGAIPGGPAEFDPKFRPAHGTQIDMMVHWMEGDEEVVVPAQDLIVDIDTQEVVELPWVFAGSGFWKPNDGGPERFQADQTGDFVCVSNFSSCLLDLPAELSPDKAMLAFVPNTELVPPLGTKVRVVMKPRLVNEKGGGVPKKDAAEKKEASADEESAGDDDAATSDDGVTKEGSAAEESAAAE